MSFDQLPVFQEPVTPVPKTKSKPKTEKERGCAVCPLNKVPGINKIFGTVEGKPIALFAQSPGPEENERQKELVGRSGQWLWSELKRVGIKRSDCDVQNLGTRCFPADVEEGSYRNTFTMRNPTTEEIRCCSIHTDNMLPELKAKQILVFGQVAAKALLKTRSLPQNKIFWSAELNAKVYLLDHPSYFIRGTAPKDRLDAFRETLDLVAKERDGVNEDLSDSYAYIKRQDYRLVTNKQEAIAAGKIIRLHALKKRRVACDIENYEDTIVAIGFSPKPGLSFVFVCSHEEQSEQDGSEVFDAAKAILEAEYIQLAFHYGCSDVEKLKASVAVAGYTHDTLLSEWMRLSDKKSYGLDAIAEARFPRFTGYKFIVTTDMLRGVSIKPAPSNSQPEALYKYIEKFSLFDIRKLSLETLRLYNGADCDLTKRIEVSNKKYVPQALMNLYIDLNFVLYRMERNGPLFDYEQNEKLEIIFPAREKALRQRLFELSGRDKPFNPGSIPEVKKIIFEELGLTFPFDGEPNTGKNTLQTMFKQHEFPKALLQWRAAAKVVSTYLTSYRTCADLNGGRLATKWKATGTRTGRLASGGDKDKKSNKHTNLQNIHGDCQVQNQLVSDKNWKRAYKAIGRILKNGGGDKDVEKWIRENLPFLKTYLILDYGQVEIRVFAQMSGDKQLKADCESSDIHTKVGTVMTGWDADKISKDKKTRTSTKNVHFGIIFGSAAKGVHDFVVARTPEGQEPLTLAEVEQAMKRYFATYKGVKPFFEKQISFAFEHHYVETMFGMRQPIVVDEGTNEESDEQEESSGGNEKKSYWKNVSINGPVQGTAHQLLCCGLVAFQRTPEKYKVLGDVPVLDVHDACYFTVNVLDINEANKKAKYLMEKQALETVKYDFPDIKWDVPIITESEAGLRMGCRVEINDDVTPGKYLIAWYHECRKQIIALNKELSEIQTSATE
jgi:uracil-DNA glycosylase family 4